MSKHKYEIEAGEVLVHRADGVNVAVGLTFYVWDKSTKKAAFCEYISHMSEKESKRLADAIIDGKSERRQRGLGKSNSHHPIELEKPIMKLLDNTTPGALTFGDPRDGSSALTTATVTLDEGHVQLPFLIVSAVESIGSDRLNTRGVIVGKLRTAKHRPKIEKAKQHK